MVEIAEGTVLKKRYEILEMVGSGGLGRVFRAKDLLKNEVVAVKVLHEKFLKKKNLLGIFHKELLISSGLSHRNIVSYVDSHFSPPDCFIVTKFVDGWNGAQFYRQIAKIPPLVAVAVVTDLLKGLDYLHMHDVIHSDLSISNIMIDRTGIVQLTDFGLSFDQGVESYAEKKFGTPGYVSPEHISRKNLTEASDVYCVGLILHALVTGERFLPAGRPVEEVRAAMKKRDLSRVKLKSNTLEGEIRIVLKKALSYYSLFRYESAQEMLIDCFKILAKYKVTKTRAAIWQLLADVEKGRKPFDKEKQDIYKLA